MMRGMYSAISGLRNHQIMLDVTANDLANVNTVGFKASRTSFRDSLAQLQRSGASATPGNAGAKSAQIGLGVQLGSIDNLMTNGAFQSTGSPYDVAITGTGWFRVSNTDPTAGATATDPDTFPATSTYEYTRAGNFTLNDQGELATQDGWRVVGKGVDTTTGGPNTTDIVIKVPTDATDVSVGHRRRRDLRRPPAAAPASRPGSSRWPRSPTSRAWTAPRPTAGARPAAPAPRSSARRPWTACGQTIGGQLEMSNVDLATEFTNMITAQRGFEASSRVLSTTDEMLQTLVNLKH